MKKVKTYQKPVHKRCRCRIIKEGNKTMTVRYTMYNGFMSGATDVYIDIDK